MSDIESNPSNTSTQSIEALTSHVSPLNAQQSFYYLGIPLLFYDKKKS